MILIDNGVTVLGMQIELYSAWKEWVQQSDNSKFYPAFRSTGGDFLGGSLGTLYMGDYYLLQNQDVPDGFGGTRDGWRIRPYVGDYELVMDGDLYGEDTAKPVISMPATGRILVQYERSALSTTTIHEESAIQYSSYQNMVTIDVINGSSGTEYPVGTHETPVNNLTHAKIIAVEKGFDKLHIVGNITFTSGQDVSGYTIEGSNPGYTTVTVNSGALTFGTGFENCTLTGTLNGLGFISDCYILALYDCQMSMRRCLFKGDITLAGSGIDVHFIECNSAIPGSGTPVIDMNGSGVGLGVRAYAGGLKLINKSGSESVSIDFISGQAIIDSTVTNGTIVIRGVAKITDNSIGATVDYSNLVNPFTVADQIMDEPMSEHQIADTMADALDDTVILSGKNREITVTKFNDLDSSLPEEADIDLWRDKNKSVKKKRIKVVSVYDGQGRQTEHEEMVE